MPSSGCPRHRIVPEAGVTKPQMTLNNVVLPAPLGPMTPSTSPCETSSETPSSAVMPPNDTEISLTESWPVVSSSVGTGAKLSQGDDDANSDTRHAASS